MRYDSPAAFRRALEDCLKALTTGDPSRLPRLRKRIVFDRLLARLIVAAPGAWVLKGGFALDLRLADRARSTKDVDLAWHDDGDHLLDTLLDAAVVDLDDHFVFSLERSEATPGLLGGTHRFRVTASLAGRPFESFILDVGTDGGPAGDEDRVTTPDLLAFAGVPPVSVPTLPLATQVAEKLHAYTRTYEGGRPSTRTKDVVDLALIASTFAIDARALRADIDAVFARRATHEPPTSLPVPPAEWRGSYRRLAITVGLDPDVDHGHAVAAAMLDPVLEGRLADGTWDPDACAWTTI